MKQIVFFIAAITLGVLFPHRMLAQNPIVRNQFSADPTARVFNGRVYVYPSHDIVAQEGKGKPGWFCMEDYHVFSSDILTDWQDHGEIVNQNRVQWVDSTAYSMWAPDCMFRNGKYYFYFPSITKEVDTKGRKSFSVGVAISDRPDGGFVPQPNHIEGVHGIDPNVLIDKDGQAYLYWSQGNIYVAKLHENMLELTSTPEIIANLPETGLKEGPFVFERNGLYYLTFPHVASKIERLEYAVSTSPMGPFEMKGVIMDESPMNCWTNHQSVVNYKDQWYLFYHQNAYSPAFDKNRAICIDSLSFNPDGTIQKVVPTLRGVGLSSATQNIEIDRFSKISEQGISVEFVDSLNTFAGWKTCFTTPKAWISYNAVDFGTKKLKKLLVKANSAQSATLQIRADNANGTILAEIQIAKSTSWTTNEVKLSNKPVGVHNIIVMLKEGSAEVDWIRFQP